VGGGTVRSRMLKKEDRFFAQFDSDQEVDFAWKILQFNKSIKN